MTARTQAGDLLEKLESKASEQEKLRRRASEEEKLGDSTGCSSLPPCARPPWPTPCTRVSLDVMMITTDHLLILMKKRMMIDWWGHIDTVILSGHFFGGMALTHTFYDNRPKTCLTTETSLNLIAEK